jgi:hypothetical protein
MSLWTNGAMLLSASEGELRDRGEPIASEQPVRVLADIAGAPLARAIVRIIQDAIPAYVPDLNPGWARIAPGTQVVLMVDGERRRASAAAVAERTHGVVADNVDGLWVAR